MERVTVSSTSRSSADVSDIVLRETSTTRLVFRPKLVDNQARPEAAAEGTFIFQRKGSKELWIDAPAEPLSKLKAGEAVKLPLNSAETLKLINGLEDLYRLYEKVGGIPRGRTELVRASGALSDLAQLTEEQLRSFLDANKSAGSPLIARLLEWAAEARDVPQLVELLEKLGPEPLSKLGAAVSVSALKEGLALWEEHQHDGREEFWQVQLASRSFLLEHLFSWPCAVIGEKAYVGGKSVHNTGGHLVDYLVKNRMTASAALVEIKTPRTALTGKEYRDGIPNVSAELAGSIVQILSYKASLTERYLTLRDDAGEYDVFDPPCVAIIGNTAHLSKVEDRRTFELFRRQVRPGVDVVTFDELFEKLRRLIAVLSDGGATPKEEPIDDDDLPF